MIKKIAKVALVLVTMIFTASTAIAQTTTNTNCTATSTGGSSTNVDCTSTSSTAPTAADNAAAMEQARKNGEEAGKALATPFVALGQVMARKRAIQQQEKNDLVAVVYCRQNPSGSWAFSGKAPMPCATLEKNVVAYCTVNAKTPICKDVAKLGPAPVSAQAAVAAPVASPAPQVQPPPDQEKLDAIYCRMHTADEINMTSERTQAVCKAVAAESASSPAALTQPQPQQAPVTTQPVQNTVVPQQQANEAVASAAEVSVAEAARRARIAKAIREAKEKAERDNPPPQQ